MSKKIDSRKTALGIEFGSTRIKAVLIGEDHMPIASGSHEWENRYENGVWTYSLEDVWAGLQNSYRKISEDVLEKYGVVLRTIVAIGFSTMMHGYVVVGKDGKLLVPFRTWCNTITGIFCARLVKIFIHSRNVKVFYVEIAIAATNRAIQSQFCAAQAAAHQFHCINQT